MWHRQFVHHLAIVVPLCTISVAAIFSTNGVDLRRAGDVNPLICCDCWKNPGTYVPGSPLEFLKSTPLDRMAEAAA